MTTGIIFEIVAYLLFALIVASFVFLTIKKGNDIWEGIKGENGKLDANELIVVVWCILFIGVVLGDLFFNLVVSGGVWASFDLILIATLGLKGIHKKWEK